MQIALAAGLSEAEVGVIVGDAGVTVYMLLRMPPVLIIANGAPPPPTTPTLELQFQLVYVTGVPSVQSHEDVETL